jgi:hypothetical protein
VLFNCQALFCQKKLLIFLAKKSQAKMLLKLTPGFQIKKIGSTPEIRPNDEKVLFENQIIVCRKVEKHLTSKFIVDK